jgi:excisionase family DNA binding protein
MGAHTEEEQVQHKLQPIEPEALLTIDEVAAWLGVNVRHVRRLVAERRIPFVKWGHLIRFERRAVANWLEQSRVDAVPAIRSVR